MIYFQTKSNLLFMKEFSKKFEDLRCIENEDQFKPLEPDEAGSSLP